MKLEEYLNEGLDNDETRQVLNWFINNAKKLDLRNEIKKGLNQYSIQKMWREKSQRDDLDTNKVYWKMVLQKLYFKFS